MCDEGRGVGPGGQGVYLDFADAIARLGRPAVEEKYGNLFDMYAQITAENPYETPMRIYPAVHYTMGGLWVDYDLKSIVPGLFVVGEANFSDHGANRLGASALMQGLADGYFVLPSTITTTWPRAACRPRRRARGGQPLDRATDRIEKLLTISGPAPPTRSTANSARSCGRSGAWPAAEPAEAIHGIHALRVEFWQDVRVPGTGEELNLALERANRVADFMEFGELMCPDALVREESCGGHFRVESQTPDGEAARDDEKFSYAAAWEYTGAGEPPVLHRGNARVRVRPPDPAELRVNLTLRIWRQTDADDRGGMRTYQLH